KSARTSCIIVCELKAMVFSPKWFAKIHFIDTRLSTHLKHTQMKDTETSDKKQTNEKRVYICDRCGAEMVERSCKVSCPNCGNRFDCSDLNIYFD
ncbi:MAG: hypothetical protein WA821_23760, partial [Anaerolineales bacterium]